jgi:large conductance mechanosensitive channel
VEWRAGYRNASRAAPIPAYLLIFFGSPGAGSETETLMLEEFRKFALRGNVVDLAVGVIIGAAFGAIVNSLVGDMIMPIIGAITGGLDFSNYFTPLSAKVTASSLAEAKKQGAVFAWGNFLTVVINFIIIAFALFLAIKGINRLKAPDAPSAAPPPSKEVQLLTEIRDALKNK